MMSNELVRTDFSTMETKRTISIKLTLDSLALWMDSGTGTNYHRGLTVRSFIWITPIHRHLRKADGSAVETNDSNNYVGMRQNTYKLRIFLCVHIYVDAYSDHVRWLCLLKLKLMNSKDI